MAHCFFPVPWREARFGNAGVSHVTMTESAYGILVAEFFPKLTKITKTMKTARKAWTTANANVDSTDSHIASSHFDGETFDDSQARLSRLRNACIVALQKFDVDTARSSLGQALHTLQDFYAHSNWVEMGNTLAFEDLGTGAAIVYSPIGSQTCVDCKTHDPADVSDYRCQDCRLNQEGFNAELTSGYYFNEDVVPIDGKCHHGM
jgi:hypothetical protein